MPPKKPFGKLGKQIEKQSHQLTKRAGKLANEIGNVGAKIGQALLREGQAEPIQIPTAKPILSEYQLRQLQDSNRFLTPREAQEREERRQMVNILLERARNNNGFFFDDDDDEEEISGNGIQRKRGRFVKGSDEAKAYMARLRGLRGKKK